MSNSEDSPKCPFLLLFNISNEERHYIHENEAVIGRSSDATVSINDVQVSRKHCKIKLGSDNKVTIINLSLNGTSVNGRLLAQNESAVVEHNDVICLANIPQFRYKVLMNKTYAADLERSKNLTANFKEEILDLDSSHCDEMKKLTAQITHFEKARSQLKEELNARLLAQENYYKEQRNSLSNLLTSSNEQKMDAEEKMKKMEETFAAEKANLLQEVERKIREVTKKEEELQKVKSDIEERYQNERIELEERCKAKIQEVEQQLQETKQNLLESELEQFRLHQEKVAVESKLSNEINNLTQETSSKEERVKILEQKLKDKEIQEEHTKKEMEGLEEEILCSICTELFIEPMVLNCGHLFCKNCIETWKKRQKICPMCRVKITTTIRLPTIDAIVNRSVALMSSDLRKRRHEIVKERIEGHSTKRSKGHKRSMLERYNQVGGGEFPPGTYDMVHITPERLITAHHSPAPLPSTSSYVIPPAHQNTDVDPFTWAETRTRSGTARDRTRERTRDRTESPVAIAAIDLTNVMIPGDVSGQQQHQRVGRSQRIASTITSQAADTTIDLTTP